VASVLRKSRTKHDFRVDINRGVEPRFLLFFELNLFFINRNGIRFDREVLIVVIRICLIPVLYRGSASFNAEPLKEVSAANEAAPAWATHASLVDRAGVLVR